LLLEVGVHHVVQQRVRRRQAHRNGRVEVWAGAHHQDLLLVLQVLLELLEVLDEPLLLFPNLLLDDLHLFRSVLLA